MGFNKPTANKGVELANWESDKVLVAMHLLKLYRLYRGYIGVRGYIGIMETKIGNYYIIIGFRGLNDHQYHLEVHWRYHRPQLYKEYGTIVLVNIF